MHTEHTMKIRTSSQNADSTGRNAARNAEPSKNALRTFGQPDKRGAPSTTTATTPIVLVEAISKPRLRCPRSNSTRRARVEADAAAAAAPASGAFVTGSTFVAVGAGGGQPSEMTGASV
jgi:hypothetical protein